MKRGLILWGALLCLLGWGGGAAQAVNYPRSATLSPFAGYQVFEGNQRLEDGLLKGLSLGANFTRHWGAEVTVGHVDSEAGGMRGKGKDRDVWNFFLAGIYHFRPDKRFVPYLLVGAGGYITEFEADGCDKADEDEDLLATYGAGFKFGITDFMALRGELRHVFDFNVNDVNRSHDAYQNFTATVGLHVQLVPDDVLIDAGFGPAAVTDARVVPLATVTPWSPEEEIKFPPLELPLELEEAVLSQAVVPLVLGGEPNPPTRLHFGANHSITAALNLPPAEAVAVPVSVSYELEPGIEGSGLSPQVQMEIGKIMPGHRTSQMVVEVHANEEEAPLHSFKLAQKKAEKIRFLLIELFDLEPTLVEARGYGGAGFGAAGKRQSTLVLKMFPPQVSEARGMGEKNQL